MRGKRIHQMQRNINNQSERSICHLHHELHLLGEPHLLIPPRQLRHRRAPISRKCINGIPPKILDRRQRQKYQQVPHFTRHPHQTTPMGLRELGSSDIPPKNN